MTPVRGINVNSLVGLHRVPSAEYAPAREDKGVHLVAVDDS